MATVNKKGVNYSTPLIHLAVSPVVLGKLI